MNKVIDTLIFEVKPGQEKMDRIETTNRTFHISPPINLVVGNKYKVELLTSGFRLWNLVLQDDFSRIEVIQ